MACLYELAWNVLGVFRRSGIITNLIYSFSANVSWQGHIGGGIAGLITALVVCGNSGDFTIYAEKKEKGGSE